MTEESQHPRRRCVDENELLIADSKRNGEFSGIDEIRDYLLKYCTTSTVYAEQSISNPDYQKIMYWLVMYHSFLCAFYPLL
jgi:hypothetical protein